jgi:hypothetical protein
MPWSTFARFKLCFAHDTNDLSPLDADLRGTRRPRPKRRSSQSEPPPSVSPATPVLDTRPLVAARSNACVAASNAAWPAAAV